jgi:hypothetical protein
MTTVLVETPIPAPVDMVWDVLTDVPRYSEWKPFITSIEGDLQLGAKLRATLELPGRKPMVFTPTPLLGGLVQKTHAALESMNNALVHRVAARGQRSE